MIKKLKIAIVSDLHCTDDVIRRSISTLHPDTPGRPIVRHPVEALKNVIQKENLEVDIVLCPGDIADQVNKIGYHAGWRYIEEIANELKATSIFATLGNHDVSSRSEKPEKAFEIAKQLKVNYPFAANQNQIEFWADNFTVIEEENYRLLIFNSVHDHFNSLTSKKVSIDDTTLEKIRQRLSETDSSKIGIAMSHHHPIGHSNLDFQDSDFIDKGEKLLAILNENSFSLYIHGHKHEPMLRTLNDVSILCAGSFSCLENLMETESLNMFHIVEVSQKRGIITSWEYGPVNGWHRKNSLTGFPNLTGYGFTGELDTLANSIDKWLSIKNIENSNLRLLKKDIEEISYLRPDQQKDLENKLIKNFSIQIMPGFSFGDKATINKQVH